MKGVHQDSSRQPDDPLERYDTLDEYVRANRETLVKVFKHGSDQFVRAFALAALVEYGGNPDREQLQREIDRMEP